MIFKERFNFILFSIALFGVILSVVIQEYNSSLISFSHESRYGLIYTADEPSYILPARNWLDQGVWKDNTEGNSSFFQRPPGYGLLYALCEWIFGKNAYLGLKTIQISAYFFSILLMGQLLRSLLRKNDLALIGTGFFALLPIFHGFMYYPLTEGITPFLVLLFCYRILKKRDNFDLTLLLITSFLLLVRPQLIVLPVLFFIYSLLKKRKLHAATLILSFVPFLIWSLRTVAIEGEWKGLHPIYSSTNVTLFRPSHEKLTELFKVWEYDGERFHSIVGGLKRATSTTEFDQVLDNVPAEFRSSVKPVLTSSKIKTILY